MYGIICVDDIKLYGYIMIDAYIDEYRQASMHAYIHTLHHITLYCITFHYTILQYTT